MSYQLSTIFVSYTFCDLLTVFSGESDPEIHGYLVGENLEAGGAELGRALGEPLAPLSLPQLHLSPPVLRRIQRRRGVYLNVRQVHLQTYIEQNHALLKKIPKHFLISI